MTRRQVSAGIIASAALAAAQLLRFLRSSTPSNCRRREARAAENVLGVKAVHDHLTWVEPMSGMAFGSPAIKWHLLAYRVAESPP